MSSTASDMRGHHARTESIVKQRSTPTKPGPAKRTTSGGGLTGSSGSRGSSPSSTSQGGGFTVTPSVAIKVTVVALVLFSILHFLPLSPSSSSSAITRSSSTSLTSTSSELHQDRKALMDGSGEAWILPKRWRDETSHQPDGDTLPECKRVMLFKFSNTHGFSSELLHYLRSLVIGQKLGYTVVADDSQWNYGSLSEYFLPRLVYCRPPSDWYDERVAVRLGSKKWQSRDRVWVSREMEKEMDEWVREEMLDLNSVREELRDRKFGTTTESGAGGGDEVVVLPEGETLPSSLEEVYVDFQGVLKEVWRPNHQLGLLIRKQRMEYGLGGGGLRHRKNSPNWGGRRRPGDRTSTAAEDLAREEEEYEQEYELNVAERSDRGPVIGVHLVPPPPPSAASVLGLYGLSPRARVGNMSAKFEGVGDSIKRLSAVGGGGGESSSSRKKNTNTTPGYSRSRPTLFPSTSTSTLVALTSSQSLFERFRDEATSTTTTTTTRIDQLYNIVKTSSPPVQELKQRWSDVLEGTGSGSSILEEWDQTIWNESIPRALKIELTRYFVRDLTTLSRFSDAFVVSGTSPTGILSILLAGEEGSIGPRDFEGGSFGGRVRSVDGFWIPTSSIKTLYG